MLCLCLTYRHSMSSSMNSILLFRSDLLTSILLLVCLPGLADPAALPQAVSAFQACHFIGMPECEVGSADQSAMV